MTFTAKQQAVVVLAVEHCVSVRGVTLSRQHLPHCTKYVDTCVTQIKDMVCSGFALDFALPWMQFCLVQTGLLLSP
jgi:hypothetical protein